MTPQQPQGFSLTPSHLASHKKDGFIRPARLSDLTPGTQIRALQGATVCHTGPVTDLLPELGLVWIFDEQSRTRRIIETHEYTIIALLDTDGTLDLEDNP
ncbi:hypothetical protein Q9R30_14145 [Arthrobacter sp. AB6]|uniref:hypothetical protein n=1 Tax=Arthrobacter sp. AB6 TaxID=2962570 RepID=UPI002881802A|nr:hypothetical protein [Arthrobacter sp. AB6]MDT0196500.1 hypothetical protein [Arthrobacter sp. AB6]